LRKGAQRWHKLFIERRGCCQVGGERGQRSGARKIPLNRPCGGEGLGVDGGLLLGGQVGGERGQRLRSPVLAVNCPSGGEGLGEQVRGQVGGERRQRSGAPFLVGNRPGDGEGLGQQRRGQVLSSVEVFVLPHSEAAALRMAVYGPCHDVLTRVLGSPA
jgi:hypothetical protein